MKNSTWYYFDENAFCYKLTSNAPDEAVQLYKEFYDELENEKNK